MTKQLCAFVFILVLGYPAVAQQILPESQRARVVDELLKERLDSLRQQALPHPDDVRRGVGEVVVDLSEQRMYVYQNGQLLWNWVVSTGRPGQETAVGNYKVQNKIPNAYAYTWSLQMPYWLGIYWAGSLQNGIHALPIQANGQRLWAGYLGRPVSFGCIILGTQHAKTLYNWASVGTPVDVVW